jgi:hypothetical protein
MGIPGKAFVVLSFLVFSGSSPLFAQVPTPLPPAPSSDVSARLNQLEAETQTLRAEVERLREYPVRLPAPNAEPVATPTAMASESTAAHAASEAVQGDYVTAEEVRGEIKKAAWRKGDFGVTPYGILWGNMVYSTERTSPGSYTLFALSGSAGPEHECIVDARNTRLGIDVAGPQLAIFNNAQSGGKVEVDFQNSVLSTENKPTILLRHAYVEVKDDDFRLLAGQTWDVISPLYPTMLNYPVGWDAGDIGYRRAQVRAERYLTFSDESLVTTQLSLNQQVFEDSTTTMAVRGKTPNWPIIEGRIGWTIGRRDPGCLPINVGVSGHIGNEEFDSSVIGIDDNRRTWSGNIDVRIPISERFGFQGECQMGENLGAFLGGIGQGVDPTSFDAIRDVGGWFEVWYYWTPSLHSHVGYSVDDPNDHDLHTVGEKSYNQCYYGNLLYDVTKKFLVGVEVSSWKTLYVGQLPGESIRTEFAAKYGF